MRSVWSNTTTRLAPLCCFDERFHLRVVDALDLVGVEEVGDLGVVTHEAESVALQVEFPGVRPAVVNGDAARVRRAARADIGAAGAGGDGEDLAAVVGDVVERRFDLVDRFRGRGAFENLGHGSLLPRMFAFSVQRRSDRWPEKGGGKIRSILAAMAHGKASRSTQPLKARRKPLRLAETRAGPESRRCEIVMAGPWPAAAMALQPPVSKTATMPRYIACRAWLMPGWGLGA